MVTNMELLRNVHLNMFACSQKCKASFKEISRQFTLSWSHSVKLLSLYEMQLVSDMVATQGIEM